MAWTPTELETRLTLEGTERGEAILRFLRTHGLPIHTLRVLDLGCGAAGITVALAQAAASVVGLDYRPDSFPIAQERIDQCSHGNVALVRGDGLALPFSDESFDLVLLNGVLEWIPEGRDGESPKSLQLRALQETRRVLRSDGHLYLAIENRYYPPHILRDPHARIPLTAAIPRVLAAGLSRLLRNRPYRTYIYSFWALSRLLTDAGFKIVAPCIPVTNYYYPVAIVRADRPGDLARSLREFSKNPASPDYLRIATGRYGPAKFLFWRLITRLRVVRLLAGSFVFLCQKGNRPARRDGTLRIS
jgi:SAM-dependent methyltransferase